MIEDEKRTKSNCYFYDFKNKNCRILRKLYCENESNCKFFKTPEEKKKDDEKYNSYYYIARLKKFIKKGN